MKLRSDIGIVLLALTATAASRTRSPLCWNYDNVLDRHPTVRREFGNSDAVVLGHVASEDSLPAAGNQLDAVIYHVAITEIFKGRRRSTIEVFNENSSGRFPLDTGVTYLLFAHRVDHGQFLINNCGNSGPVAAASAALDQVRRLSHRRRPSN